MNMTDQPKELLPCPICLHPVRIMGGGLSQEPYSVCCFRCGLKAFHFNRDTLTNKWNTRATDQTALDCIVAQNDELNRLRAEVERLKRFYAEDMRVTNESASFHVKECSSLRQQLTAAQLANGVLREALGKVMAVSSGEDQVADDDTGGMQWIYTYLSNALNNKALATTPTAALDVVRKMAEALAKAQFYYRRHNSLNLKEIKTLPSPFDAALQLAKERFGV